MHIFSKAQMCSILKKEEITQDLLRDISFKFTEMDCQQTLSPKLYYLVCSAGWN